MTKPYTLNAFHSDGRITVDLFEEREEAHAHAVNLIGNKSIVYATVTDERNGHDTFTVNNANINLEV